MTKKRKILLILSIPAILILLFAGLFVCAALYRPEPEYDFDDPESLWMLAERTERYIIQSTDRGSSVREEALKALEDIALLEVSDDEKAKLIRERFPEESFWTDDVKDVLKQAEAGDAEAQFLLGCFYLPRQGTFFGNRAVFFDTDPERGRCVMKSEPLAFKWFRKAAMQGHAKAQSRLAYSYFFGHPAHKNIHDNQQTNKIEERLGREMEEWYTKAGIQGDPFALSQGFGPVESKEGPLGDAGAQENRRSALAIWRKAAGQGNVEAMLLTAYLLHLRFNDDRGAVEWCRKAAELGSVAGMMNYASYHEKEMEIKMADDDTGPKPVDWEWRRKAFDTAMKRLDEGSTEELRCALDTFCLEHLKEFIGDESEADFITRLIPRLLDQIERHGDYEISDRIIGVIQTSFENKGIACLGHETITRQRAEPGNYRRQNMLALILRSGPAAYQAEAVRLYRKLAGFGYADAQQTLGLCYLEGRYGVPQDKAEAVKWFRKAAEQRCSYAMDDLSECLLSGEEPTSWSESIYWGLRRTAYPEYDSFPEYLINWIRWKLEHL